MQSQTSSWQLSEQQKQLFDLLTSGLWRFAFTWGLFSILVLFTGLLVLFGIGDLFPDRYMELLVGALLTFVSVVGLIVSGLFFRPIGNFKRITAKREQNPSWLVEALTELTQAHSLLRLILALSLLAVVIVLWNVLT